MSERTYGGLTAEQWRQETSGQWRRELRDMLDHIAELEREVEALREEKAAVASDYLREPREGK